MIIPEDDPGFFTKTSFIQLMYGIWVNLAITAIGLAFGFPAIQIPQLTCPDSTIFVTVDDISWIGSVLSLFCPIGCMFSGLLMDKFGRTKMLISCQLPMLLGWLYTGVSQTAKSIIIGRALTGIGCGMAFGPPRMYTAEISLPNMRGVLGALPNIFLSLGIAIQALMGSFLQWNQLCYICAFYNLLLLFSYFFLQETPHYLLLTDTTEHATKALSCFRAKNYHAEHELNELINFKQENNIRSLTCLEQLKVIFSPASCKPFLIVLTYATLGQLAGISIVTFWGVAILQWANSSVDPYTGNVFIAGVRIIFGIVSSVLLYKITRTTMALTSAIGMSLVCLFLGVYLYVTVDATVMPLLFLMAYTAFACLGFYILPFLLMTELFPLQVRGTLSGIIISLLHVVIFGSVLWFPYVREIIGFVNILFLFGVFSLLAAIFIYCFWPETKDLTLQDIEEYYNKRRSALISQRQLAAQKSQNPNCPFLGDDKEKNLNDRSFVEVTVASTTSIKSITSRRRSVSLMIGDKQFKCLTAAENQELQNELKNLHHTTSGASHIPSEREEIPLSSYFFDAPDHHTINDKRKEKLTRRRRPGEVADNYERNATKAVKNDQNLDVGKNIVRDKSTPPGNPRQPEADKLLNASEIAKHDGSSKAAKLIRSEQNSEHNKSKPQDDGKSAGSAENLERNQHADDQTKNKIKQNKSDANGKENK